MRQLVVAVLWRFFPKAMMAAEEQRERDYAKALRRTRRRFSTTP